MAQPPDGVHVTIQTQRRKCGKSCCKLPQSPGHGPYVYGYWRESVNGVTKLRSAYLGKAQPTKPQNFQTTESRKTR